MTQPIRRGIDEEEREVRFNPPVYQQRYNAVISLVKHLRPKKVVDMGCAECKLLRLLRAEHCIEELIGVDIDGNMLEWKKYLIQPLTTDYLFKRSRPLHVALFKGSIASPDARMNDTDLCCCIEIIEHLEMPVLQEVPCAIFGIMRPSIAIFSTPNADYNILFPNLTGFRHWDHKFEWSRREFQTWCLRVCCRYGYTVEFDGVGDPPPETAYVGYCSQMAIFTRQNQEANNSQQLLAASDTQSYELVFECDHPWDNTDPIEKLCQQAEYYLNLLQRKALKDSISEDGSTDEVIDESDSKPSSSDSKLSSSWVNLCDLLRFRPVSRLCSSIREISFALRTHSQIVSVSSDGTQAKLHEEKDSTSDESSLATEPSDADIQPQSVEESL